MPITRSCRTSRARIWCRSRLVAGVPFVLVVNPSLPVNSITDLVKVAKQRPLNYGSGGAGTFHHLNAELLSSMLGINMTHVPYKGSAPAMTDLIAGTIQVLFVDIGPSIQWIRARQGARAWDHQRTAGGGRARDSAARRGGRAQI